MIANPDVTVLHIVKSDRDIVPEGALNVRGGKHLLPAECVDGAVGPVPALIPPRIPNMIRNRIVRHLNAAGLPFEEVHWYAFRDDEGWWLVGATVAP